MPSKNLILGLVLLICLSSSVLAIDATLLTKGYLNATTLGSPIFIKVHATSTYGIKEVRVVIWRPFDSSRDDIIEGTGDRHWYDRSWYLSVFPNRITSPGPDGVTYTLNCFNRATPDDYLKEGVVHFVGVEVEYWTNSARTLSATYNIPVETLIYDNTPPSILSVTPLPPLSNQPRVPISTTDPASGIKSIKAYIYYKDEHGDKFYYDEATENWSELGFFDNKYRLTSLQADTPHPGSTVNNTIVFSALTSGKRYYYNYKITDFAGNITYGSHYNFIYDGTPPEINISSPPIQGTPRNFVSTARYPLILFNGNPWNIADQKIQGTASDAHSVLNKVELYISDYTISTFDTNTNSWTTALVSPKTFTPGNTFIYSLPNQFFTGVADGANIFIQANAYDSAGNKKYLEYYTFFVDNLKPTSTIATDALLSSYPTEFRGTTVDIRGTSDNIAGIKSVKIKASRLRDGVTKYWGMGWTTPHNPWEIPMPFLGWVDPSAASFLDATVDPAPDVYTPVIWTHSLRSHFWTDAQPRDVYTVYAWATDNAGNTQATATQKEIRIDNTQPFVSMKYPRNHFKADAALPWIPRFVTVIATDPAGAIAKVEIMAKRNSQYFNWVTKAWDPDSSSPDVWKVETIPATPYGEYNFLLPTPPHELVDSFYAGLADGDSFVFTVKATDKTSHVTQIDSSPIVYDITPPTNPAPRTEGIKWQNTMNAQVAFIAGGDPVPPGKAASGLLCYVNQITCPNGSTKTINSGFVLPTATSFDWVMDQGEGIYNLRVISLDWALNWAANPPTEPYKIATFQVGYDIQPPNFDVHNIQPLPAVIETLTPIISWSAATDPPPTSGQCSGIKNYKILLDGALLDTVAGLNYTIPTNRLVNGTHGIQVVAVDNAQNETPVSININVQTIEPPQLEVTCPTVYNSTTLNLEIRASDDSLVKAVEVSVNGGAYDASIFPGPPQKEVTLTPSVTLVANTNNTITVRAIDDTNKVVSVTAPVLCDTELPTIELKSPLKDSWTTAQTTFRWEGNDTLSGIKEYKLIVDGSLVNTEILTTTSYQVTLSAGDHSYYVIAYDNAGNSRNSKVYPFKVDAVAPTAFTIAGPTYVDALPLTLTWDKSSDTDSGLAGYKIYMGGQLKAEAGSDAVSAQVTGIEDGTYDIYGEAYDVAGNVTRSNTLNTVINTKAPDITVTEGENLLTGNQKLRSRPNLVVKVKDILGVKTDTLIVKIDGRPLANLSVQATETQAESVTACQVTQSLTLNPGSHTITVTAKDRYDREATLELKDLKVAAGAEITGPVRNYPNPFTSASGTTIVFNLSDDADVTIRIYSMDGRLKQTMDYQAVIGENSFKWDGKDYNGKFVANGAYYVAFLNRSGKVIGTFELAVYE